MNEMQTQGMDAQKATLIELVLQAQDGNRDAFGELYNMYRSTIYRFCLQYLSNEADAEELVQDVFCEAFQNIGRLNDKGAFYKWLRKIARNKGIDNFRRNSKHPMEQKDDWEQLEGVDGSPLVAVQRCERDRLIRLGLSQLSGLENERNNNIVLNRRYAELLEDCYLHGKSEKELQMAHPELPAGTIKQNLHRGKACLRRIFLTLDLDPEDSYL